MSKCEWEEENNCVRLCSNRQQSGREKQRQKRRKRRGAGHWVERQRATERVHGKCGWVYKNCKDAAIKCRRCNGKKRWRRFKRWRCRRQPQGNLQTYREDVSSVSEGEGEIVCVSCGSSCVLAICATSSALAKSGSFRWQPPANNCNVTHIWGVPRGRTTNTQPPHPLPLASCFASSLFTHLRQHVFSLYIEIENISLCACHSISAEIARVVCRRSHCFRRPFDRGQCGIIEKFLMAYALQ